MKRIHFKVLSFLFLILIISASCNRKIAADKTVTGFDPAYEPKIDSILAMLTLEEKIHMIHGNGMFSSAGVSRLNIPDLKYTDGPTGIREELERYSWNPLGITTDSVTFFPTGTALGATWNTDLAYDFGIAIGSEANSRGKHILLAPGVNIIRTPVCGRNFEYYSEDPFLSSAIAVEQVKGIQEQHVAACVKHYAANNQEYKRSEINVLMDERTLREIYLPSFRAAVVDAEAYSVMGSYNKFRGHWLCENEYMLNTILKNEWGFKGAVVSDWGGTHSAVKAAKAGLDVEMGGYLEKHHFIGLGDSVKAGLISESVIDSMVKRILRITYNCHLMDTGRVTRMANTPEISRIAYNVASESVVLLKNDNNLLPLNLSELNSLAVIGSNAVKRQSEGGFTADVKARYEISPLEGIIKKAGDRIKIDYQQGYAEKFITVDTGGRWPMHYPDPRPDLLLIDNAVAAAKNADAVLLFAGTNRFVETEAMDRKTLDFPFGQDELIKAVCAANPKTIIIVVAGSACNLNIADSCSPAILYSWFNGSEGGNAIADIIFGNVNPSGKLPFTIPVKLEDIPAHALNAYPGKNNSVEYKEGILVGYRWFDTKQVDPLYCFGHGLSYTQFSYSDAGSNKKTYSSGEQAKLKISLSNEGKTPGKETVQVYVQKINSSVPRADKELKAFKKIWLQPGEKQTVQITLDIDDLAYFDNELNTWVTEPGEYTILFASSSEDIRAQSKITIK